MVFFYQRFINLSYRVENSHIRLYEKLGNKIFDEKKITDELVFVYMEKMPV